MTAIGFFEAHNKTNILIEAISSSDVSEQKNQRVVLGGSGNDKTEAYENLKSTLTKPLYFDQVGIAVFENTTATDLHFLKKNINLNLGIFVVKSNDVKGLFEVESPNGVLGYDIIGLIKNYNSENKCKISSQLYQVNKSRNAIPLIKIKNQRLFIEFTGD